MRKLLLTLTQRHYAMEGDDPWRSRRSIKKSNSDELLAINVIGDYCPTSPPKKHIHVLVEPPPLRAVNRNYLTESHRWRKRLINQPMVGIK
jgi:hypothetical protein